LECSWSRYISLLYYIYDIVLDIFSLQVELTGRNGKFIAQSRRIAMLRYKSWILHSISTLIFSPALLAGPMEEKQELKIEMFSEFLELVVTSINNFLKKLFIIKYCVI